MKETKNARPSTELEIEKWGVEKAQHSQNIPFTILASFSSLAIVSVLDTVGRLSEAPSGYQDSFLLLQPLEVLLSSQSTLSPSQALCPGREGGSPH